MSNATDATALPTVGTLLREWRERRRLSQLDLALEAGVSARHISRASARATLNVLRLTLHPEGMAPNIVNLGEWRGHLIERLGRQVVATGDPALAALHEELVGYPGGEPVAPRDPAGELAVPLRLRAGDRELSFISTVTTFGSATEITVSELTIEAFYPADRGTAETLTSAAA